MNNISEALLSAWDILLEDRLSTLQYDKTIQAEIYSIVNLDEGEYKVKYSGNIFSAFARDIKEQYKVGDSVYVTIPEGDFSNRKIISNKINNQSLSYGQMVSLSNAIMEASPTFDTMYRYDPSLERGVVAGAPKTSELSYNIIYESDGSDYNGLFKQYNKTYDLIRVKASFLTAFHSEHSQGNYGIEIQFFTESGKVVNYKLDLQSFNGNPYSLSTYSPQYSVIQVQKEYLTGIKQIKLFEEGFVYDRYVEGGLVTDRENTTVPNIFVKDIAIQFVERKDLTDNLYYLNISAPQGNSFTPTITSLDLVGKLIYQGEDIINESTCDCRWYERDLSIVADSDLYDKDAGVGWRGISSNSNRLTLTNQDVIHKKEYKLIVVYNQNVIMSAETAVFNLLSNYDFELSQSTIKDGVQLQIINKADDEVLIGDWYLSYPDGSYSSFDNKKNSVVVTNFLLYSAIKFYCGVYNTDGTEIIGILEYTITDSGSEDDVIITYIGEDIFRYDANGDITIEDSEKERTLQAILSWRDGVGAQYTVDWIGPDGQNLTNVPYTPQQSMMENLWIDNNNILHYTIKQRYKISNNVITLKITTATEQVYTFQKEILFLKDGDSGTNGTTYIASIRPCDSDGNKLSGLNPLIYENNIWKPILLRCYVYNDGELINNNNNYELTYQWNGANINIQSSMAEDRVVIGGKKEIIEELVAPYAKVQVTINDKMNGRKCDIYCYYPIDAAINFNSETELPLIDINIPKYIKYTSSGINPSFDSNNITFTYNNIDYTENITSLTENILAIQDREGLRYLKPASSFIFEDNTMALLKCAYTDTQFLLHPIIFYLNTYGNEAINGWDGTKIDVNEEGGYILAPQIGAGTKNELNQFSGVVMGTDSDQKKTGLYGYQNGVNTFGLMEDGVAYFGPKSGGGQIVINGNTAKIYGGGILAAGSSDESKVGGDSENGMTITLANLNPNAETTEAIKIGAGKFKVLYNGQLIATGAEIAGTITAEKGYIGGKDGWVIDSYRIYSAKSGSTHIEFNCNGTKDEETGELEEPCAIWCGATNSQDAINNKFAVTKTGALYAKEGNIGGWNITRTSLYSETSGNVGMASSGNAAFWAGAGLSSDSDGLLDTTGARFLVTRTGKLYCSSADVAGKITANSGKIGNWTINSNRLEHTTTDSDGNEIADIYLGTTGFKYKEIFWVNGLGAYLSGGITASYGKIGGWTINSEGLWYDPDGDNLSDTYLCQEKGFRFGNYFAATPDFVFIRGSVYANGGRIGKWYISPGDTVNDDGSTNDVSLFSDNTIFRNSGEIWTETFVVGDANPTHDEDGNLIRTVITKLGELGTVMGNDGVQDTTNVGIKTYDTQRSIILHSARNIALRCAYSVNHIFIEASKINFTIYEADNKGIWVNGISIDKFFFSPSGESYVSLATLIENMIDEKISSSNSNSTT